jgi:hypothetical protein
MTTKGKKAIPYKNNMRRQANEDMSKDVAVGLREERN